MKKQKPQDHVIRVTNETYQRMVDLKDRRNKISKKETYGTLITEAISLMEDLENTPPVFLSGNTLHVSLEEARGAAIQEAVTKQITPQWPSVVVVMEIAKDEEFQ